MGSVPALRMWVRVNVKKIALRQSSCSIIAMYKLNYTEGLGRWVRWREGGGGAKRFQTTKEV